MRVQAGQLRSTKMEDIIYKSSASRSASASSNEARLVSTLDSTRLVLDRLRLWLGRFSRLNAGDGARAACTREQSSAEPQAAVCLPATQTSFKWHEVSVRYTRSGALAGTLQLASDSLQLCSAQLQLRLQLQLSESQWTMRYSSSRLMGQL